MHSNRCNNSTNTMVCCSAGQLGKPAGKFRQDGVGRRGQTRAIKDGHQNLCGAETAVLPLAAYLLSKRTPKPTVVAIENSLVIKGELFLTSGWVLWGKNPRKLNLQRIGNPPGKSCCLWKLSARIGLSPRLYSNSPKNTGLRKRNWDCPTMSTF